jgi:hypothetical protein
MACGDPTTRRPRSISLRARAEVACPAGVLWLPAGPALHPEGRAPIAFVFAVGRVEGPDGRRHGIREVERDWADHVYGIPRGVFAEAIARSHTDAEILGAPMFEGAADALRAWRGAGVEVHVVSHRHPRTARATKRWLRRNGVGWDAIVLDTRCDKLAYALDERIDLIIDDKPELLGAALDAGLAAACVALPVNTAERAERGDAIVAAPDWPSLRWLLEARFAFGREVAAVAA